MRRQVRPGIGAALALGVAPLAFAQWSVSGNNIFYNTGNVGIGTTTPAYRFVVQNATGDRSIYSLHSAVSGFAVGVWGEVWSNSGFGVLGFAPSGTGLTYGVFGQNNSSSGRGVGGLSVSSTGFCYGVYGEARSSQGAGVFGVITAQTGVNQGVYGQASSVNGRGVFGHALATTGLNYGVLGRTESVSGIGVSGFAAATAGTTYGVYGAVNSPEGFGVYAQGDMGASGLKSFRIDHPLRPETHYLYHYCTEAPEPLNAYSGVATLDTRGEAWVQLPNYFEAINRDPRYTLTPLGAPMPNLHVAVEIQGNRFKIAGGAPGRRVSWRVEAIRNDPYVQRRGFQTEREKPREHQGKYLHPELYGQPKERAIHLETPISTPSERVSPQ
ncbi:MAG: hypothetical protein WHS44_00275 [Fimbriimonadales bacterium]|nr:MAG: hypothetical protein KatS3mg018_0893 [Fimbriimonadales bacterium]